MKLKIVAFALMTIAADANADPTLTCSFAIDQSKAFPARVSDVSPPGCAGFKDGQFNSTPPKCPPGYEQLGDGVVGVVFSERTYLAPTPQGQVEVLRSFRETRRYCLAKPRK